MKTAHILLVQYDRAIIPLEDVRRDYFAAYEPATFMRKLGNGDIPLPVVRLDGSQKGPRGVHINHLAVYLDAVTTAAEKEARALRA